MNEKRAKRLRKIIKHEHYGNWNKAAEATYNKVSRDIDKTNEAGDKARAYVKMLEEQMGEVDE